MPNPSERSLDMAPNPPAKMTKIILVIVSVVVLVSVVVITLPNSENPSQSPLVQVSPIVQESLVVSPSPSSTPVVTSKVVKTSSKPMPSLSPTPSSTAMPSPTPVATPTPQPSQTPTPIPSPTPDLSGTLTLGPVDDTTRTLLIKSANTFGLPAKYQSKDGESVKIKSITFEMYLSPNGPVLAGGGTQFEISHPSSGITFSQNLTTFASVTTDNNGAQRATFNAVFSDPIIVTKGTTDNINFSFQNFAGSFSPGVFVELTIKSAEIDLAITSISGIPKRITFTYQGGVN